MKININKNECKTLNKIIYIIIIQLNAKYNKYMISTIIATKTKETKPKR